MFTHGQLPITNFLLPFLWEDVQLAFWLGCFKVDEHVLGYWLNGGFVTAKLVMATCFLPLDGTDAAGAFTLTPRSQCMSVLVVCVGRCSNFSDMYNANSLVYSNYSGQ